MASVDREGIKASANTVRWVNLAIALSVPIGGIVGWQISQSSSRAAVEAVVGTRLERAEKDIIDLRVEQAAMRLETTAIRVEIAAMAADVRWMRERLAAVTRIAGGGQ